MHITYNGSEYYIKLNIGKLEQNVIKYNNSSRQGQIFTLNLAELVRFKRANNMGIKLYNKLQGHLSRMQNFIQGN